MEASAIMSRVQSIHHDDHIMLFLHLQMHMQIQMHSQRQSLPKFREPSQRRLRSTDLPLSLADLGRETALDCSNRTTRSAAVASIGLISLEHGKPDRANTYVMKERRFSPLDNSVSGDLHVLQIT